MRNLIAFPLLLIIIMVQSSIISNVNLLSGYADAILVLLAAWALQERVTSAWHWALTAGLLTSFVTRLPWAVVILGYCAVVFVARTLSRRVWQVPLLAMFSVTFIGTIFMHALSFIALQLLGTPILAGEALGLITLPSLLLNMLIAIPMYTSMRDLSGWVYPMMETE